MRKTNLKEMYIVRYADDFRIFCRTKTVAERTKIAITQWLKERLKLEVSKEKTRFVNVKKCYSEFLGFKIKVHPKGGKKVVKSHISDKQLTAKRKALVEQVKRIRNPRPEKGQLGEIFLFNKMVMRIQNYYRKKGRKLTPAERTRYGKSAMLRYLADEPIYPIGYVQHKFARCNSNQDRSKRLTKSNSNFSVNHFSAEVSNMQTTVFLSTLLKKNNMLSRVRNLLQRTKSTATIKS